MLTSLINYGGFILSSDDPREKILEYARRMGIPIAFKIDLQVSQREILFNWSDGTSDIFAVDIDTELTEDNTIVQLNTRLRHTILKSPQLN